MFVRPNGSVTGSINYAELAELSAPKKKPGRPAGKAAAPAAASPPPAPEPVLKPEPEPTTTGHITEVKP